MPSIRQITAEIEAFAPLMLQESYDNAGLQVGDDSLAATGALLCVDVTEDVVDEAIKLGVNLIIAHHPLLFRPLKRITGSNYIERIVMKAIRHDIAIYAAHTNLDAVAVNHRWAKTLGLTDIQPLQPVDLIPIANEYTHAGMGVVGNLPGEIDVMTLLKQIKELNHTPSIRHNASPGRKVRRVALCGGAGASLIDRAISAKADIFITGEVGYHPFFGLENNLILAEIGHYESEQHTKEIFCEVITKKFPKFATHYTTVETNPIKYL